MNVYLYCINEPLNRIDPWGLFYIPPMLNNNMEATQQVTDEAICFVSRRGFPRGPIAAFSRQGEEVAEYDYKFTKFTFQITDQYTMQGSEYTNWLTAYTCTYLFGTIGNWGTRFGGHYHALTEPPYGFDDPASRYFISGGVLMGDERQWREMGSRMSDWDFVRAKTDLYYGIERVAETDFTSKEFDKEFELFLTFWRSGSPRW